MHCTQCTNASASCDRMQRRYISRWMVNGSSTMRAGDRPPRDDEADAGVQLCTLSAGRLRAADTLPRRCQSFARIEASTSVSRFRLSHAHALSLPRKSCPSSSNQNLKTAVSANAAGTPSRVYSCVASNGRQCFRQKGFGLIPGELSCVLSLMPTLHAQNVNRCP